MNMHYFYYHPLEKLSIKTHILEYPVNKDDTSLKDSLTVTFTRSYNQSYNSLSFWASGTSVTMKRDPRLWSLILGIAKRDAEVIQNILEDQSQQQPQLNTDEDVTTLIKASKGLLPTRPILHALQRYSDFNCDQMDYLEVLIRLRDAVNRLAYPANPETPETIKNFVQNLPNNETLSSLVDFALSQENSPSITCSQ